MENFIFCAVLMEDGVNRRPSKIFLVYNWSKGYLITLKFVFLGSYTGFILPRKFLK